MKSVQSFLDSIVEDVVYQALSDVDKNVYLSYNILGELLDPDKASPYTERVKHLWVFEDSNNLEYYVRLVYQPLNEEPFFEVKHGWLGDRSEMYTKRRLDVMDFTKSDTIAAIYRDETIPFFLEQSLTDTMVLKPLDIERYKFSERLVKKLTPQNLKIDYIENELTINISKNNLEM